MSVVIILRWNKQRKQHCTNRNNCEQTRPRLQFHSIGRLINDTFLILFVSDIVCCLLIIAIFSNRRRHDNTHKKLHNIKHIRFQMHIQWQEQKAKNNQHQETVSHFTGNEYIYHNTCCHSNITHCYSHCQIGIGDLFAVTTCRIRLKIL